MVEWRGAKGEDRCKALGRVQCCPRAPIHRPPHRGGGPGAKGEPMRLIVLCFFHSFIELGMAERLKSSS